MTETERIKQIISYSDRQKQHEKGNYAHSTIKCNFSDYFLIE